MLFRSAWSKYFNLDNHSRIFEIEFDHSSYCEVDANFLKGGIDCDPLRNRTSLYNYWSGKMSPSPLPELIIELPVFIKRQLSPSEFII